MKQTNRLWLLVSFFLFSRSLYAQELPFKPGDRLTYELEIYGLKAGTETDEVIAKETKDGQITYHLCSKITTNPFVSLFYKVNDRIDCWIKISDLQPVVVLKDIQQGKQKKYYDLRFDHQKHQAIVTKAKKKTIIKLPPEVFDPLSLIYYLRTQELKVGDSYELSVLSTTDIEKVTIEVVAEEEVISHYGRLKTLRVEQRPGGTIVWFSKDKQRLPIIIELATKVAKLRAKLATVEQTASWLPQLNK